MKKKDRILKLYKAVAGKMPANQVCAYVAARADTSVEYVRVVTRQRMGGTSSEIDERHREAKNARRRHLYHTDPDFRARSITGSAKWKEKTRART